MFSKPADNVLVDFVPKQERLVHRKSQDIADSEVFPGT
jgi:hypothetical protein